MLRNSVALLAVGVLSKGMGLIIAVLVARFLGPQAMGLFALLFSIALLVENISPLGLQDVLVRDVAARPQRKVALWRAGARMALFVSAIPTAGFAAAALLLADHDGLRASLITLAIGTPFASLALVSQATLQGMERVLYITWVSFGMRIVSLIVLVIMLWNGAGIEAAFVSRLIFQAGSSMLFALAILRERSLDEPGQPAHPAFVSSVPFALVRILGEVSSRAPLLLLPLLFGLSQIGFFDAADRIRLTLGMVIAVATTAIMPAFARSFAANDPQGGVLVAFTIKYVCLILTGAAAAISVFADDIVHILYGPAFAQSAVILQVLAWAQMLVATDAVLKQAMLAHGREYAVVGRAVAGVICLVILLLALGRVFGLQGAAAAVLVAAAVTLALDLHFTIRRVLTFEVGRFVFVPIACGAALACVLLALDGAATLVRLAAALAVFLLFVVAFRLIPAREWGFLKGAFERGLLRRMPAESDRD